MNSSLIASPAWKPAVPVEPPRAAAPMPPRPRISRAALAGVVLAHAALLAALLNAPAPPEPVTPPRPLMVSLIEPAAEVVPQRQPEPRPQRPRPVSKPLPPPPVLTARQPVPAADPQPPAETARPEPAPEVTAPPAPATEAAQAAAAPPSPPTPPRPADYLANPKPTYPQLSRRLGEEGTVRLNILVNPDGSVARLEVAKSSGYPRLDRAAMETVQSSWKFEPARQGGKPVAAWVIVPIQFTLRS